MSTISIILSALAMAALPVLIVRYLLIPLDRSPYRTILIAAICLGACVSMFFLVLTASIPSKTGKLLDQAVEFIETETEKSDPGYLDTVLDRQAVEDFISGGMDLSSDIGSDPRAEILLEVTRLRSFKKNIDTIMLKADEKLAESDSTAFTPRNILGELKDMALDASARTAGTIGTLLDIIVLLFYAAIAIAAVSLGKGWFKARNSSLNFGSQDQ